MSESFRFVLDQGLPYDAAEILRSSGVDCAHAADIGMSSAADTQTLEYTSRNKCILITLDADFHAMMILGGMSAPSVIRLRIQGLDGRAVASFVRDAVAAYTPQLAAGCLLTIKERKTTCRLL